MQVFCLINSSNLEPPCVDSLVYLFVNCLVSLFVHTLANFFVNATDTATIVCGIISPSILNKVLRLSAYMLVFWLQNGINHIHD